MNAAAATRSAGVGQGHDDARRTPSQRRAIDLVYLARQTLGDRALEAEILALMRRQIGVMATRLDAAGAEERRVIAHGLKGSALNVGAFDLAEAARTVEAARAAEGDGTEDAALQRLRAEMRRVALFIEAVGG